MKLTPEQAIEYLNRKAMLKTNAVEHNNDVAHTIEQLQEKNKSLEKTVDTIQRVVQNTKKINMSIKLYKEFIDLILEKAKKALEGENKDGKR